MGQGKRRWREYMGSIYALSTTEFQNNVNRSIRFKQSIYLSSKVKFQTIMLTHAKDQQQEVTSNKPNFEAQI